MAGAVCADPRRRSPVAVRTRRWSGPATAFSRGQVGIDQATLQLAGGGAGAQAR